MSKYLEDNIAKRLTLSDICRDNLVGRSYLQKIFREKTGGGAMEYFGTLKIDAAKRMIREGTHNFTEIAALLGYNSIHYFSAISKGYGHDAQRIRLQRQNSGHQKPYGMSFSPSWTFVQIFGIPAALHSSIVQILY